MPELTDVGGPLWWVQRLEKRMDADDRELRRYDDYYEGKHPLGFTTGKFREAFGSLFRSFSDNWCDLVVDAVEERLDVSGFRFGDEALDGRAWDIWQRNALDAESQVCHTEALIHGRAAVLVWPDDENPAVPRITVEHPREMVIAVDAADRRQRRAALKRWVDDDGYARATLYTTEAQYRFRSRSKVEGLTSTTRTVWDPIGDSDSDWIVEYDWGVVPVVPMQNRHRLLNDGVSEIAKVIPVQDGINKLVADMLVASEFGAAPQRWATGIEVPRDPVTGKAIPAFENLVSRLWASEESSAKFGQFPPADLSGFVQSIELLVQHVASQTRTPPHYFYLSGQFPSGESIKSAETGLVAKARRKMRRFGEGWEEVMRLGLLLGGDPVGAAAAAAGETLWGDPESRSESEHVDAVLKQKAANVPEEALWEQLGRSPQEIDRYKQMRREQTTPVSANDLSFRERADVLAALIRSGFDAESVRDALELPPFEHTGAAPVTLYNDSPAPADQGREGV